MRSERGSWARLSGLELPAQNTDDVGSERVDEQVEPRAVGPGQRLLVEARAQPCERVVDASLVRRHDVERRVQRREDLVELDLVVADDLRQLGHRLASLAQRG